MKPRKVTQALDVRNLASAAADGDEESIAVLSDMFEEEGNEYAVNKLKVPSTDRDRFLHALAGKEQKHDTSTKSKLLEHCSELFNDGYASIEKCFNMMEEGSLSENVLADLQEITGIDLDGFRNWCYSLNAAIEDMQENVEDDDDDEFPPGYPG